MRGDPANARANLDKAWRIGPNAVALNNLAFLIADSGGNLTEAAQLVGRTLKERFNSPAPLITQAWIYLKQKSYG